MAQGEDYNKNREGDVQKDVVYYDALVNAWLQNRLERNRQLLTISYLAVGLLLYLISSLQSDHLPDNPYVLGGMVFFWLLAFISFIVCGILTLLIVKDNPAYLKAVINEEENHKELSQSLERKENISFWSFFAGVASILVLSSLLVCNKYHEVQEMSEKNTVLSSDKGDPRPADNYSSGVTAVKPPKSKPSPPAPPPAQKTPPPTTKGGK